MKKKYKIEVNKKCIAKGDDSKCPIDYAAEATFECSVTTDLTHIRLFNCQGDRIAKIELPQVAKDFIDKFDSGKPVKPFTFEVLA